MTSAVVAPWDQRTALALYRATMRRIAAWWDTADVFDKPCLNRRDIQAADKLCQAAWQRRDWAALTDGLARWEHAICGGGR